MIIPFLNYWFNFFVSKCEQFTNRKYWVLTLTLLLPLVVLFFAFPTFERIPTEFKGHWDAILHQIQNPFAQKDYIPFSHEAKITYRLSIPFIARLLNLEIIGLLVFQAVLGTISFYMTLKIFLRLMSDKIVALFLTLSFAFIYAGKTSFIEVRAMFDGVAIFFLIASIYFKNPFAIFIAVFLSSWTDERGLVASSLVFVFWLYNSYSHNKKIISWQAISVVLAWIAYFATRLYLSHTYNLKTETEGTGFAIFREQINNLPIGIWSALEGFWVIVIIAIVLLIKQRQWLIGVPYLFSIGVVLAVGMSVTDITRSVAYVFPAVFLALSILEKVETKNTIRKFSLVCLMLSFLYPTYDSTGDYYINWVYPLPLQILRMIYGTGEVFGNV